MQTNANIGQKGRGPFDRHALVTLHQSILLQRCPGVGLIHEAACAGNPADGLQVSQAPRTLLDIGFQAKGGKSVAQVTFFLFGDFGGNKLLALHGLFHHSRKAIGQCSVTTDPA